MAQDGANKIQKSQTPPEPTVLSINICDSIIRDELTKKVSLIGLFGVIKASGFPCSHPIMQVYIALTNGHGKYKTEIRFTRLEDNRPIAGMVGELQFQNPLQVAELNLCWQQLVIEKAGEYAVEVLCNDKLVGSRKFMVLGSDALIPPTDGTEVR